MCPWLQHAHDAPAVNNVGSARRSSHLPSIVARILLHTMRLLHALVAVCGAFAPAVRRAAPVRLVPLCAEPSRMSKLLHKVSFGFLGSKPEVERPKLFMEAPAEMKLDGAKYADDLEAFMDTPAPARPARKQLKAVEGALEGGDEEGGEGATAVKEIKAPREALASESDIEKMNRLFGMSSADK